MSWSSYRENKYRGGMLIGINGVARSGKDTIGQILVDNHGFERIAFADALRLGLYNMNPIVTIEVECQRQSFWEWLNGQPERRYTKVIRLQEIIDDIGWERAKVEYPEVRELMQKYGTEGGRMVHGEECWVNIIKRYVNSKAGNFVITDMRFENEIAAVRKEGGLVVQVQRPGVTSVNGHASDRVLPDDYFDEIIQNDGTIADLEAKVNELVIKANPLAAIQEETY